jgi:two-component system, OmpR family, phosphate regulon sensor histidine kinase PhoR
MDKSKLIFPIIVTVLSIVAVAISFFLYVYWYLEVSDGLNALIRGFQLDRQGVLQPQAWVVILVLSILVGFIIISIFTIFIYTQKNYRLYRLQHNFINNFTHELKTPVTSLKLYLETFQKHELSRADQLKYIDYMIQDAGRLSDNISRILSLAKIESRNYGKQFSVVDLVGLVKEFIRVNRRHFAEIDIEVVNPSQQAFFYRVDSSLFEMLLMNLISNAANYNTAEQPRLVIRFDHRQRTLHIRFEDNGIGIARAEIKKVFKKFYRIPVADQLNVKGTGIGLYLAAHIMRIHRGRIRAESQGKGLGSAFSLILPYYSTA